jgi:hypothetical protein
VIDQPELIRSTRIARPFGVRRALAWDMRVLFFGCGFDTYNRTIRALSPSTT